METAESPSRSSRVSVWSGMGVSQTSTSSPIWCEAWPVSIGPPRGWPMSPTRRPGQPSAFALAAKRSMKSTRLGWPQARLREGRITCQPGPSAGSGTAPAMQPRA